MKTSTRNLLVVALTATLSLFLLSSMFSSKMKHEYDQVTAEEISAVYGEIVHQEAATWSYLQTAEIAGRIYGEYLKNPEVGEKFAAEGDTMIAYLKKASVAENNKDELLQLFSWMKKNKNALQRAKQEYNDLIGDTTYAETPDVLVAIQKQLQYLEHQKKFAKISVDSILEKYRSILEKLSNKN